MLAELVNKVPLVPPSATRVAAGVDDILGGAAWVLRQVPSILPFLRLPAAVSAARGGKPSLGTIFGLHAAVRGDKAAVVDSRGTVTYAELDERVNRLANALLDAGLKPGGRVAFLLPNCREAVEAIGAAAKLGLAPVPINTRFQGEEVGYLLERQGAGCIIVEEGMEERIGDFSGVVLARGADYERRLAQASAVAPAAPSDGAAARMVIHTSGTTGRPKGAERDLTSTDPVSLLGFLARIPVASNDVVYTPAPLFHALGFAGLVASLLFGATLVFRDNFDPADACRVIEAEEATAAVLVPVMLRRILEVSEGGERHDLSTLRWVLCSGSALPPALEARSRKVVGAVVRNLYGSTEAGFVSIATPTDAAMAPGTVGRPLPGVHVEIHGPDGELLPSHEVGEIVVRSKTVFEGYTEDEARTEDEAPNDRHPEPELYHLGDLGWLDDTGYLFVADRVDDMVVTGGENVYPAEVERVLADAPGVNDCAVLGVTDEEYGKILVAYVVQSPGATVDPAAAAAYCRSRIANYKVPKHVWVTDELPYNATGKVLRRVLREDAEGRLGVGS